MDKVIQLIEQGKLQEALTLLEQVCTARVEKGRCWTGRCKNCRVAVALAALRKRLAA